MKGLFVVAKNQLNILELPIPEPGPFQALVRVEACSICNSTDWKLIEAEFFSGSLPMLLGHESVGRVERLGAKVRSFHEGDLVLRSTLSDTHLPFPGARSCWGGFVEYALVTDAWAEKDAAYNDFPHPQQIVPVSIPPTEATALITLKETLSCLGYTAVQPGQSLAIIGSGPVAQALTCFAHLLGLAPVVVFGRRPELAPKFERLGADAYASGDDFPPEVNTILAKGGFDRVIEAVGARQALSRGLQVLKPEGRLNLYGIAPESEPYFPEEEADPRVVRAPVVEAEAQDNILQWVEEGKIRLADWYDVVLPWSDYAQGFQMVKDKTANKVVLKISEN